MFKAPFSFDGRIRRIEYFLSYLLAGFISGLIWSLLFAGLMAGSMLGSTSMMAGGTLFGALIGIAVYVAMLWFCLAQGVKRLHDVDKSGWLILLLFIPIVGFVFGLYLLFADGTVGPNQFGPDPKNRMPYQAPSNPASPVNVTVTINRDEVKVETTDPPKATVVEEAVVEVPADDAPIDETPSHDGPATKHTLK